MAAAPITGINPVTANSLNASIGTGGILPSTAASIKSTFDSIKLPFAQPTQTAPVATKPVVKPAATPTTPPKEPATLSSSNIDKKNTENVQKATQLATTPTSQSSGQDGFVRNSDQSFAEAPGDAVQVTDANGNSAWQSGGMNYAVGPLGGNVSSDPFVQGIYQQFTQLKGQMDALGAQQIANIQNAFGAIIEDQKMVNKGEEAGLNSLLIRGGSLQTGSASGIIGSQVSVGLSKIADLNAREQAAVIAAQQAIQSNDMELLNKQLMIADEARKERQASAQKLNDSVVAANKTSKIQNGIRNAIAELGTTDTGSILDYLNTIGVSASVKDVSDTISALQPNQKELISMLQDAGKYGAPADKITQAAKASDVGSAINILSPWLNDPTSTAGQYKAAVANGYTGTPGDYLAAQEYKKAYNQEKGKAAATGSDVPTSDPATMVDQNSQSILAQTGLSGNAFFWLTGRSSQLPRDQATRNAAAKEATAWANAHGIDISTLPSQYDAYNKTLSFNTVRQSMAVIQENEIQATIKNLEAVSPSGDLSDLRWSNVQRIWAGQEVNDPVAQQYAFHLEQLRNEMVAYNLIAQGQINTDGSLKQATDEQVNRAAEVIKNGVAKKSLAGLATAVDNSTTKMRPVLQASLDAARKAVWDLFGVGDKFIASGKTDPAQIANDAKSKLQEFYSSHSDKQEMINEMWKVPGANYVDIAHNLGLI